LLLFIRMVTAILIAASPALATDAGFESVTGPCHLRFPADHGPHPQYRTEWWYYTGNLVGEDNRQYGFQLTFFRSGLQPPDKRDKWPDPSSAWRTDQVYLAHAAVSDIEGGRHFQADQMARPVLSMAGARVEEKAVTVWVHSWETRIAPDKHKLHVDASEFGFTFDLIPAKPPVLHGDGGYSRKGQSPERASCYYSFTRLQATGSLTVEGTRQTVQGSAWMDHEFSTAPLQPGVTGWDWFSLQLSDETEIMFFQLRQADGEINPASNGTWVQASGSGSPLRNEEVQIEVLDRWTSPHTGARYPVKWRLQVPSLEVNLTLTANLKDQEMRTARSTQVVYWEGSVQVVGARQNKSIEGVGYVELTGYAKPFDAPM